MSLISNKEKEKEKEKGDTLMVKTNLHHVCRAGLTLGPVKVPFVSLAALVAGGATALAYSKSSPLIFKCGLAVAGLGVAYAVFDSVAAEEVGFGPF